MDGIPSPGIIGQEPAHRGNGIFHSQTPCGGARIASMDFSPTYIDHWQNASENYAPLHHHAIRLCAGAQLISSTVHGPLYLGRNTQWMGVTVGKYTGMGPDGSAARCGIGAFCAFGARNAINPFNHPTDWLSTHEFQYHPGAFDWVAEYNDFRRLERSPEMFEPVVVGNDVWTGHNVTILAGVAVGDGAIIGAGAVVTKNVPPYAKVAGVPAKLIGWRYGGHPRCGEIIRRLRAVKWWDLPLSELSGLPFNDIERCLEMLEERKESRA